MNDLNIQVEIRIKGEDLEPFLAQVVEAIQANGVNSEKHTKPKKMTPIEASRHALFGGQDPDEMGLLVDSRTASKLLGVSSRKLYSMYSSGEMPEPTRVGRAVRWSYEELRAWVNAGCPNTKDWNWKST